MTDLKKLREYWVEEWEAKEFKTYCNNDKHCDWYSSAPRKYVRKVVECRYRGRHVNVNHKLMLIEIYSKGISCTNNS